VCRRRLANHHDAEDAFQATFLVLIRRAARLSREVPLGPWLHHVAVMTARNVQRTNRRRAVVTGPMDHEVPAPHAEGVAERLDIDAALLTLPERYRVAVVLCHLQGLSRREAAALLGCPEGTLSSLLSRALVRLRARLGSAVAGLVAVAGTTVPTGLHAATVRSGMIYSTSTLTAAGVSPAVAGLTSGVLRMFWMKKVIAGLAMSVLVASGLLAGLATKADGVAHATAAAPGENAAPDDLDEAAKRLEKRLADLEKQKELLDATLADIQAEKKKLDDAKRAKAAAAALGPDIAVVVKESGNKLSYAVREVTNGKVGEMTCSDLDVLAKYLTRAFNDPNGPKSLRISADRDASHERVRRVFEVCAAAGYKKASFTSNVPAWVEISPLRTNLTRVEVTPLMTATSFIGPPFTTKTTEVDLAKYRSPKKP
jgi:RNA polymerase sigma factor (sigma-70 family)